MARVPIPRELATQISQRAMQFAREDIASRMWSDRSIQAVMAFPDEGQVGLKVTVKHLMYQNRGIRPFVMWWAEGRVIPLPDGNGGTRPVRAVGVGTPGWVTLPGGVRKWRDQRWRHPGLKPKNFLENALQRAIDESRPQMRKLLLDAINGGRQYAQQ